MIKKFLTFCACVSLTFGLASCGDDVSEMHRNFKSPPESARPGVYWYFMDGNLSKEGMTKDLESMRTEGIGHVIFLEVNVGVPRGKVDFLSDEWQDCFKHAVMECERLGIGMTLGIGPGWTGSGGPWVKGEESMQSLVSSVTSVSGGGLRTVALAKPAPIPPFFGEGVFTPELHERWQDYYADVAVLAFPKTAGTTFVKDIHEKALYYRAPYSSVPGVKPYIPRDTVGGVAGGADVVPADKVMDLTEMLDGDTLRWDAPAGEWTVMRLGARNNGAVTRPAPLLGVGFECDKADTAALMAHLRAFTEKLFTLLGERDTTLQGGLKLLHMDSWEMGAQNWTPRFRQEFMARRGYDPQPYYPVYAGYIVGSKDISERFLWDLRQTMQELMLDNHAGSVRAYAHKYGMQLSIEPYDMNPMQDLELGAAADVPMCEFWSVGRGYNTTFGVVESSSLANIKGQRVVPSEAFTSDCGRDNWEQHPASMKNQTDWAFAAGINRLMFHTYQHQPLPDSHRPGMAMGPYGVHWDRNQTWWPYVDTYHTYVSRCQYMLQQGQTVADVLYLAPEEAPFVFRAPQSALGGNDFLIDKRGHNFDACPASLLYGATVADGRIKFPSGMEYSLLVLPVFDTMTPRLLEKVKALVQGGATVVGVPPLHAPGLTDYPASDQALAATAEELWGDTQLPDGLVKRAYGAGAIYWGRAIRERVDNLYPDYGLTAEILTREGVAEDFRTDKDVLRYIHKRRGETDYYFVSNRTGEAQSVRCTFRVSGKQPQLWDALTGAARTLPDFSDDGTGTTVALEFEPDQSFFILFDGKPNPQPRMANFLSVKGEQELTGGWKVAFDPRWGGPEKAEFEELADWSKSGDAGIRYYSGTAVYVRSFEYRIANSNPVFLNLGRVRNIARVTLNGKDLGVVWTYPWEVDITRALRKGSNELRIEVTNLWPNRMIGDEFLPDDAGEVQWPDLPERGADSPTGRFTYTTHRCYTKDSPLLESGLLGPVRIVEKR